MSQATLNSLAMLKVSIDQGGDYLEYLRPFILQVLVDHLPAPITDDVITNHLKTDYGLAIPQRTVQVLLKRISRSGILKKAEGIYQITKQLPDPGIATGKAEAERHILAIISGLRNFCTSREVPALGEDEAVNALCEFLSEFSIPCLRAYLRGTAIPDLQGKQHARIVLVSHYVVYLQKNDPERFESLMILLQGHMLANGLLCPDLQNAPKSYKGVTFYLDTPLLVQHLGLEGEAKKYATEELIELVSNLGATVATFSHSREELDRVINGAANHIDSPDGRGAIIFEARKSGTTRSDLLLVAGQVDEALASAGIAVETTPAYERAFQIDERAFENVLDDEVSYYNKFAKTYDVNSIRSIYVLRRGQSPYTVEKCRAVLVTSNSAFSRAAFEYGKQHTESREVSSVITDFGLANMAWLKAPMGAPSLPKIELLAYAYAALRPSMALLNKYLGEIDRLERQGTITPRDHQLLRSSTLAQEELTLLTLGEETSLTEQTISETLSRVTEEIKGEEAAKFQRERISHQKTQERLEAARTEKEALQKRLFWKCRKKAQYCALSISTFVALILVSGVVFGGLRVRTTNQILWWFVLFFTIILALMTLANLIWGVTVLFCHRAVESRCLTHFLKQESKATGLEFGGM